MNKTYVKIKLNDKPINTKFNTIDEAVAYAEQIYKSNKDDVLDIYVYNIDGTCEHQKSTRNKYSNNFVYYVWDIYGENFFDENYSEFLAEGINSEKEARDLAETFRDKFDKFNVVTIASYSETIEEHIGDLGNEYIIYERSEPHE